MTRGLRAIATSGAFGAIRRPRGEEADMRRVGTMLILSTLMLAASAGSAAAAKPTREFLPAPEFIQFAAGELCDFPVRIDVLINKEYGTTFFDEFGQPTHTIVAGRLVLRLVNLDTSKSVIVNASGPGLVVYEGDNIRVTLRGRSLIFLPSDHLLYLNTGQVVEFGNGSIQPVVLPVISQIGRRVDYCPILG
jgi:hypothetical protein